VEINKEAPVSRQTPLVYQGRDSFRATEQKNEQSRKFQPHQVEDEFGIRENLHSVRSTHLAILEISGRDDLPYTLDDRDPRGCDHLANRFGALAFPPMAAGPHCNGRT
jgi:hypothetical protein